MEFPKQKIFFAALILLVVIAILSIGIFFILSNKSYFAGQKTKVLGNENTVSAVSTNAGAAVIPVKTEPRGIPLSNPPVIIKAVYVTGYSAGSKKYLDYLSELFKSTEINAAVIDIKDYSGLVSYYSDAPDAKKYKLYNNAIPDIDALINFLHSQNIYVVGRIAVFEDPSFSKARPDLAVYEKSKTTDTSQPVLWQDNHKLSWLDPASKDVWDYDISLAKDAFSHGFDEINFDYVRFPSDGKVEDMGFPVWDQKTPKSEVIKEFFNHTRASLSGKKISVDLFGETTINKDDMGIGQIIENAFENFDYISPMVYPSHYANGFMGFSNPAEHPYEVVKYSMDSALSREKNFLKQEQNLAIKNSQTTGLSAIGSNSNVISLAKFRPWLQDFNLGAYYTADMIKQEIRATQDSLGGDYNGFMLWSPSNIYTSGAVEKTK